MKFIAHRGNYSGIRSQLENSPGYLKLALSKGFDVEVDAWINYNSNQIYLGHDIPRYEVSREFLRDSRIWVHCKTVETLLVLHKYPDINCFYQTSEKVAVTSKGFLWLHSSYTEKFINNKCVLTNLTKTVNSNREDIYGFCSDSFFLENVKSEIKKPFDILVIDIDGVLAAGKFYDKKGKVFLKLYPDIDFTAIKRFQAAGVRVIFLSGDTVINEAMAKTRKIEFFYNEVGQDKVQILCDISRKYNIPSQRIGYIGDDYYDISCMCEAGTSFCPKSSPKSVRDIATYTVDRKAGEGVIAGAYDLVANKLQEAYPEDSANVNPK